MGYPTLLRSGFMLPTRLKASYEGAGQGRRAANWQASSAGPINTATGGLQTLRSRSRHARRNDPYAASSLDKLVSNHIGTGIIPKPKHPDAAIRTAMQERWDDWCEESDADQLLDFYGQQALAASAVFESGECFVRLRTRRLEEGLSVPLQVQLLEPEFVPHTKNGRTAAGHLIRQGIEFNALGKRVAYWMYRSHPGERGDDGGFNELIRVPADQVLHVFEPTRPGQLRGTPYLSPVLLRLKTLDEFDDAVLFRQEVANLFAGFIRRQTPETEGPVGQAVGGLNQRDVDFAPMVSLEPGTMQELAPGDEVAFSDPPDAGNNYPDFMRQQLAAIAAGIGLPYELLTGDLRQINDRVIRVVLNEFRRRVEQRQFAVFVHQFCRPIRNAWLSLAVLSGALSLPGYAKNSRPYKRTLWVPQGWPYIHPVQDVQSDILRVRAGFTSRSGVVLKRGDDPEAIDRENQQDNERADQHVLRYDSDPRFRDAQGEAQLDD